MAFFLSAVGVLQTLVIAHGAGLGIWGVVFVCLLLSAEGLSFLQAEEDVSDNCIR